MYVIRDTSHPEADLERNWSAPAGGASSELAGSNFQSVKEAHQAEIDLLGHVEHEYRYHPAYASFVEVHYEGLGAELLDAESLTEAMKEAADISDTCLACCAEAGSGHFFAEDVKSFHKVREGRYVFEIK